MQRTPSSKSGASLLELVVAAGALGLLVGIVLSAVNMTRVSAARNQLSTIQADDLAATAFRLKYNEIPGDLSAKNAKAYGFIERSGLGGQGDGDGLIGGCGTSAIRLGCENILFWRDLSQAQLIPRAFKWATNRIVDGTAPDFQMADYLPPSPFRPNVQLFLYGVNGQNFYYIAKFTAVQEDGIFTTSPAVTPQEASNLDDKMDDGAPMQGRVRAMDTVNHPATSGSANPGSCLNAQGGYQLPVEKPACQLAIRSSL